MSFSSQDRGTMPLQAFSAGSIPGRCWPASGQYWAGTKYLMDADQSQHWTVINSFCLCYTRQVWSVLLLIQIPPILSWAASVLTGHFGAFCVNPFNNDKLRKKGRVGVVCEITMVFTSQVIPAAHTELNFTWFIDISTTFTLIILTILWLQDLQQIVLSIIPISCDMESISWVLQYLEVI